MLHNACFKSQGLNWGKKAVFWEMEKEYAKSEHVQQF